jgi:ribosome-associated toxin RatA of RatAB toxin-antitoxin module
MGQKVKDTTVIRATPAAVYAVIVDLAAYPQWADGVQSVEVLSSQDDGLPHRAAFRADARVAEIGYTLEYTHDQPSRVSWTLVEGDMVSQLDGVYGLEQVGDTTRVHYSLEADLSLPLPGFMLKRGAKAILQQGLSGLKARVEGA